MNETQTKRPGLKPRWFKVTFLSPNVEGHLAFERVTFHHPKKVTKTQNCQASEIIHVFFLYPHEWLILYGHQQNCQGFIFWLPGFKEHLKELVPWSGWNLVGEAWTFVGTLREPVVCCLVGMVGSLFKSCRLCAPFWGLFIAILVEEFCFRGLFGGSSQDL